MLPNKPELTAEEKHAIKSLFAEESNYSNTIKEIINGLVFGSDELFNVLTPLGFTKSSDGIILLNGLDYHDNLDEETFSKARDILSYYLESYEELKINASD